MTTPESTGMQTKDWITIAISLAALGWSIWSYVLNARGNRKSKEAADEAKNIAKEANSLASKANDIASNSERRLSAESEVSILRLINEARIRVNDIRVKIADLKAGATASKLNADQIRHIEELQEAWDESQEMLLNSYELACGMYRDGKIDKERFKRQYSQEIKTLMETEGTKTGDRLRSTATPYRAIKKVYDEWHDLERD